MAIADSTAQDCGATDEPVALVLRPMSSHGAVGGQSFRLDQARSVIGRRDHTDVVLPDKTVSGEHAAITRDSSSYYVEDLHSSNGTLLNGSIITRSELNDGDVLELGIYRLKVCLASPGVQADAVQDAVLSYVTGSMRGIRQPLNKALTKISSDGFTAIVSRRRSGYYISYLDGGDKPTVNGRRIGPRAQLLRHQDEIELGSCRMRFECL
jgi:pSer/pThr/pTyr-binding forkhead associated (FHA) protein